MPRYLKQVKHILKEGCILYYLEVMTMISKVLFKKENGHITFMDQTTHYSCPEDWLLSPGYF